MKRDMELIRLQLMRIEGDERTPDLSRHTEEQWHYHIALLIEAGLVEGVVSKNRGIPVTSFPRRLTWSGHEFLDAARNETVWTKTLTRIKKEGITVGFEVLKTTLIEAAKDQLRSHGILK